MEAQCQRAVRNGLARRAAYPTECQQLPQVDSEAEMLQDVCVEFWREPSSVEQGSHFRIYSARVIKCVVAGRFPVVIVVLLLSLPVPLLSVVELR